MKNITLLSALLLTLGSVSAQAQMTVRRAPHSTSPLETLKAKVARSMGKLSFKDIKMVKDQRSAAVRLGIMARQRRVAQEEENHHLYKPQHQIEYVVNDDTGEYEKSAEYTFTYAPMVKSQHNSLTMVQRLLSQSIRTTTISMLLAC